MEQNNKLSDNDILNARYNNAVTLKEYSAAKSYAKSIYDSITLELDAKDIDEIVSKIDKLREILINKKGDNNDKDNLS